MEIPKRSARARLALVASSVLVFALAGEPAPAAEGCEALPSHAALTKALEKSISPGDGPENGGLEHEMWAALVARSGRVCAVARSGETPGAQWPGSRAIAAQKAYTANAFSLPGLALSTANLWAATQPGGSLFGLQASNPVDPAVAYRGQAESFGTPNDPLVGERMGGVNVFGGGVALYHEEKGLLGGLGVSGDTSCADHNIAWRVRDALGLAAVPAGVHPAQGDDGIVYDVGEDGESAGGFGHPRCGGGEAAVAEEIGAGGAPGSGASPEPSDGEG